MQTFLLSPPYSLPALTDWTPSSPPPILLTYPHCPHHRRFWTGASKTPLLEDGVGLEGSTERVDIVFRAFPLSVTENSVFLFWPQVTSLALSSRLGQENGKWLREGEPDSPPFILTTLTQCCPQLVPILSVLPHLHPLPRPLPRSLPSSSVFPWSLRAAWNLSNTILCFTYPTWFLLFATQEHQLTPDHHKSCHHLHLWEQDCSLGPMNLHLTEVVDCESQSKLAFVNSALYCLCSFPNRTIGAYPEFLMKKGIMVTWTFCRTYVHLPEASYSNKNNR